MRKPPFSRLEKLVRGVFFLALTCACSALAQTGATTRISLSSSGAQGDDHSYYADVSANGRYIAFSALASTLVPGDGNNLYDVFVRDRTLGTTRRVSVSSLGQEASDDDCLFPVISGDGRYVAFDSGATNLVPGETNRGAHTLVHDLLTGETTRVSVSSAGVAANSSSLLSSLSFDGRFVAFSSFADNLVPDDTNANFTGGQDVFVHDRATGETTRVSVASDGAQQFGFAGVPSLSADGRFVAFECSDSDIAPGDGNDGGGETFDGYDIFVHDRLTGETVRASVSSAGQGANTDALNPAISGNGRFVTFWSEADNLVPNDTNGIGHPALGPDVFVHDLLTRQTTRVSVSSSGGQGNFGSYEPAISANGRYVAFWSVANNLVIPDLNGPPPSLGGDIFIHDRQTAQTTLASVTTDGLPGLGLSSVDPALSADGRFVAFESEAVNLVPNDTNAASDVFLRERLTPLEPTGVVSRKTHGGAGPFDLDLALFGPPGIECRTGGSNGAHTLVFSFAHPLSAVTGASVTAGNGAVSGRVIGSDPRNYVVNLTGVSDAQTITVTLSGVQDSAGHSSASIPARMTFGRRHKCRRARQRRRHQPNENELRQPNE